MYHELTNKLTIICLYSCSFTCRALIVCFLFFFFHDTATTEIYTYGHTLSLHDALPISFAYTSTAFPMLTGTLVTVAGFVPIGLNASSAGEYTFTLFAVIAVAMLVSWIVAEIGRAHV